MLHLSELLVPQAVVCACDLSSRDAVLTELVRVAAEAYGWTNGTEITSLVLQREGKMSTGIGLGMAVPHARLEALASLRLAVACIPGGVDFAASDRKPVRLVWLLVSPMDSPGMHVQALAAVSCLVQVRIDGLVEAKNPSQFLELLAAGEKVGRK